MIRPPCARVVADRRRRRLGNAIGLVERKTPVEIGIAGRREARRERDRGEVDADARRMARMDFQSIAKPADGGSKAAGCPAIGVQTSHNSSGAGTCAYWIGRPCRASPAHTRVGGAVEAQQDEPWMIEEALDRRRQRFPERQDDRLARAVAAAADLRSACGSLPRRRPRRGTSSAPRARRRPGRRSARSVASDAWPASRTSISAPVRTCTPRRLAGSVAASFAITKSPGRRNSTSRDRRTSVMCPLASTTSSRASGGRWTGRSAAIIGGPPRASRLRVSRRATARATRPQSHRRAPARRSRAA